MEGKSERRGRHLTTPSVKPSGKQRPLATRRAEGSSRLPHFFPFFFIFIHSLIERPSTHLRLQFSDNLIRKHAPLLVQRSFIQNGTLHFSRFFLFPHPSSSYVELAAKLPRTDTRVRGGAAVYGCYSEKGVGRRTKMTHANSVPKCFCK